MSGNVYSILELTSPVDLEKVYRELLEPSFPPDELVVLDQFLAEATPESSIVLGLSDGSGEVQAVSVAHFDSSTAVLLLEYLAVRPGTRSMGLGGQILTRSLELWRAKYRPDFILGEVERPGQRENAAADHGDAEARLRFYRKFDARQLLVPYFQPGLTGVESRIPMILMALHISTGQIVNSAESGRCEVSAAPLLGFLRSYLAVDGHSPDDVQAVDLFDSLAGPTVSMTLL